MTGTTFVRRLADRGAGLAELGGKGDSLARLAAAGLPVPDGFHVTTASYRGFVADHGLQDVIMRSLDHPAAVRALFDDHELAPALSGEILTAYAALGQPAVAVRSSATAEDLPGLSFAGQQETFLNVRGQSELLAAVRRCWASLWTERAVAYRARFGISPDDLGMAVVVQRLVDADAAGVMFTADPITGATDAIKINSAWGLGEAVVGGEVTPDSYVVDTGSGRLTSSAVSDKLIMTVRTPTGTTGEPVPAERRRLPSLTAAQAERLARLGVEIAQLYQTAVDVEWCRSADELWIVQARPLTTTGPVEESRSTDHPADLWNDSRSGYFLWTNTNTGEAMPDVMTPATWSIVQLFLHDVMATSSIPPHVSYGLIGGRIYLNLSVLRSLSHVLGVSEKRFRRMTQEVFGRVPADVPIPHVRAHRLRVLRATVPVTVRVLRTARRDSHELTTYLGSHARLCAERRAEIAEVTSPDLLARMWRTTLLPEFHKVSWMLSAATRSSGASFITIRQRLQNLVGDQDANAITAGLGAHAGELASLGLLDGLDQLAEGTIDERTFNETYGHRGPHEFEISMPRPAEQPGWIASQLAQRDPSHAGYRELIAAQEKARLAAWARLEALHRWQAKVLRRQLVVWAEISRHREAARTEIIRYLWVLRTYALKAAELTGLGDDVFFLGADEIVAALLGQQPDSGSIEQRRATYEGYRGLPNYPSLILGRFDPYAWAADPDRRSDVYLEGVSRPASEVVSGFPGSAGIVEGLVRVIMDADGSELQSGEVLVTTITNVGWTPLFPRAAAVVTDVGAPLSHAAIVARELGIPAVVGCGNATMLLHTGDRVRVNGSAGTVEVLATGS